MSESNEFEDIEELLTYILEQEFINPDDIELVASKFKNAFLTIENKEGFFPFLSEFVKRVEGDDRFHEERVEALKTEIESFYDRIGTNFSVYHIADYKDPQDPDLSEKFSDDDDDKLSFLKDDYKPPIMGNINIPEGQKSVILAVLEKLSSLYQQKYTYRIQSLQKWRQLRLADQIQRLKKRGPAIGTIIRCLTKQLVAFYRLKGWNDYHNQQENEEQKQKLETLQKEIDFLRDELYKSQQDLLKNGIQMKKDQELEKKIQKLQNDIQNKLQESEKWKNMFENQKKELNEKSKEDRLKQEKMEKLKQLLGQLEKREKILNSKCIEKDDTVKDLELSLHDSKIQIDKLIKEIQDWKQKYDSKDLKSFQKIRHFMKNMKLFEIRLKAFGFMKIFKRKEKAKLALTNVTQRIKARLLIQTRHLYCGQDIMKSYLKWMLKSRPDFIRESISKIPLTGRINQHVAFWRMKKLVFKPIVKKLSESAKALRRLKGFFALHRLMKSKEYLDMYHFLMQLNPNHRNTEIQKIDNVFTKMADRQKLKAKSALQKMKNHKDFIKEILRKMIQQRLNQQRVAFWLLRNKNVQGRQMKEMLQVQSLLDRLARNKRDSYREFFEKFKDRNLKSMKLINKIIEGQKGKQANVLSRLLKNKNDGIFNELKENFVDKLKEFRKQGAAKIMRDNLLNEARKALEALKRNKEEAYRRQMRQEQNQNKIKDFFLKLADKKKMLKGSTLNFLRNNNTDENDLLNQKRKLLELISKRNGFVQKNALDGLRKNNQREKDLNRNRDNILRNLFKELGRKNEEKQKQSLRGLRDNRGLVNDQQQKLKDLLNKMQNKDNNMYKQRALRSLRDNYNEYKNEQDRLKALKKLAIMLKNGLQRKAKQGLLRLSSNQKEQEQNNKISDLIKKKILQKLGGNQKLNQANILQKLRDNKNEKDDEDKKKNELLKKVFKNFGGNQSGDQKDVLKALRRHQFNEKNKKADAVLFDMILNNKRNLKKYLDTLRNFNRDQNNLDGNRVQKTRKLLQKLVDNQRAKQRGVLNSVRENVLKNEIQKLRDHLSKLRILSRLALCQNAKKCQQFYRLIINKKDDEQQNEFLKQKKNHLLNRLLNYHNKKRQALNSLRNFNKAQNEFQNKQANVINNMFNNLNKKRDKTMVKLVKNNLLSGANKDITSVKEKLKEEIRIKHIKDMFGKLKEAQLSKAKKCYNALRKNQQDLKNSEKFGNYGKISALNRLIKKQKQKQKQTLKNLKQNKNDSQKEADEQARRERVKLRVLGGGDNEINIIEKFKEVMQKPKKQDNRSQPQDRFLNLLEYMELNNGDDRYDPLLTKSARGELKTPAELESEAKKLNKNGKFDEFLKKIKNPKLEMQNLQRWMQLNNQNGKFNHLLQEMKKNPLFNKQDLVNYLDKNNIEGKYDDLKQKVNFGTLVDELIDFMKKNNKDGKYSQVLDNLKNSRSPKLVDLINICQLSSNKEDFAPLMKKINESAYRKQMKRLLNYIKRNNGDGRYDNILRQLDLQPIPKLSHAASYIRHNKNEANQQLRKIINQSPPEFAEKIKNYIKNNNDDNRFNLLQKKLESRKNPSPWEVFRMVKDLNKENLEKELFDQMNNPKSIQKYIQYMKDNNQDGKYDKILSFLKAKYNPQKTDLYAAMNRYEQEVDLNDLLQQLPNDSDKNEMQDFLSRKNENNKYNTVLNELSRDNNTFELFKFVSKNKRNLDYKPIYEKINGHEDDDPSPLKLIQNSLEQIKQEEPTADQLLKKISLQISPTFSSACEILYRQASHFDKVIKHLQEQEQPEQIEQLQQFLQIDPSNPQYQEIKTMVLQRLPLTDLLDYVEDNQNKYDLYTPKQILNQDYIFDLYDKLVEQMKNDNDDGKYNKILNHLSSQKNPGLQDIIDFIHNEKNPNGVYDELIDMMNQKQLRNRFLNILDWIYDENQDGVHDDLINFLEGLENPKLSDVIRYITKNNHDGRFNPLLARILGRKINSKQLFDLLNKKNKDGKFDDVLEYLKSNQNTPLEEIIAKLSDDNHDGRFDDLIQYLLGENEKYKDNDHLPFEDYLRDNIDNGHFQEIEDQIDFGTVDSPNQFRVKVNGVNNNGKYDDLLDKFDDFLNKNKGTGPNGSSSMNIPLAQKNKAKLILDSLRNFNKEQKNKEKNEQDKIRNLMLNMLKRQRYTKLKYLNDLLKNKNSQFSEEAHLNGLKRKCLQRIIDSHIVKKGLANNKLQQYNNEMKQDGLMKNSKLGNLFGITEQKYNQKKNKLFDALRNMNRVQKEMAQKTAKQLAEALKQKLRQALQKLRDNNMKMNEDNDIKNTLFNKYLNNYTQNSLRKCLNQMRKFNEDQINSGEYKNRILKETFNQMNSYHRNTLRKCLDSLRDYNQEQNNNDQYNKNAMKNMFASLGKHSNDNLRKYLQNLRDFNREQERKESDEEKMKNMLFKSMNDQCNNNLRKYLQMLRDFNRDQRDNEGEMKNARRNFSKDLINSQNNKLKEIFEALRRNNLIGRLKDFEKQNAAEKLLEKVKRGMNRKAENALGYMMENKNDELDERNKIERLLKKLYDSQNQKQIQAQNEMKKNYQEFLNKERRDRDRLKNIMEKAYDKYVQRQFYKLIENCLLEQKREKTIDGRFKALDMAWRLKGSNNLHDIQKNYLNSLLDDAHKKLILTKLINCQQTKKKQVYDEMNSFIYNKKNKTLEALKVIRKNIMQDVWFHYRVLKMNKFLKIRNKTSGKMNNLLFCLNKNHKALMRQAFHHWAGSDLKNKIRITNEKIKKIIMAKENQGFQAIKKQYLSMKFQKFIKGMMKLVNFVEGRIKDDQEFFWNQLVDRNLWYQRIIDIWTIRALPNNQIAFWKMRYAKNLRQDGVSAEKALKLKKLIEKFETKIKNSIDHSYWQIKLVAQKKSGSSFVSVMKNY